MSRRFYWLIVPVVLLTGILAGLILSSKLSVDQPSYAAPAPLPAEFKPSAPVDLSEKAFAQIALDVTPTVVTIISEKKVSVGGGFDEIFKKFHKNIPEQGVGSGVIVRADGYILTNNHVVTGADLITVKLSDKRVYTADLLGADPLTDIAVVKIDADQLPVTHFGNSDELKVGEWVLAVGSPMNLNSTVTAGIVSALGRQIDIIGDQYGVESFIQTDAVINPGNSGGALVNIKGELIGINTAIATKTGVFQGYGFAVPANLARNVMSDILQFGQPVRGYVGVGIKEIDAIFARAVGLTKAEGVLVESLTDNGAAKESDLREGDVILDIDGRVLSQPNDLQAYVALKKPGDQVKLTVYRDRKRISKTITLRAPDGSTKLPPERKTSAKQGNAPEEIGGGLGFEVEEVAGTLGFSPAAVMVSNTSWYAREHNIFEGYNVTRLNEKPIRSLDDFQSAVKALKNRDAVVIHLVHEQTKHKIITAIEVRKRD